LQTQLAKKESGAFYTPRPVAEFLSDWAVRQKSDRVLEPAAGRGVFLEAVVKSLNTKGLSPNEARSQVLAIEKDLDSWKSLQNQFADCVNVIQDNFLLMEIVQQFDAVVGNPPYVERQRLQNYEAIKRRPEFAEIDKLSDIYGYFIVKAGLLLKTGGRLAFIVSDTWMNMDFGAAIKNYLLRNFRIRAIVSFDRRVFPEVLVRAVLLLCEKGPRVPNDVLFVRLKDPTGISKLMGIINSGHVDGTKVVRKLQSELEPSEPWSVYLKGSETYFDLLHHPLITKLSNLADTSIGLFSLANDFYIIDEKKKEQIGIEDRFVEKIALGPRTVPPSIESKNELSSLVIYCNKTKQELNGTGIFRYIESAERKRVTPVGKTRSVLGYQNLPRLQRARRTPWYNLVDEIERRCRAPILIPRRIYRKFAVVSNKVMVPAGDNFICVRPSNTNHTEPLLCLLNSSLAEYFMRVGGQIYGGGVSDMRPDDVKNLPTIDLTKLSVRDLNGLAHAYIRFLGTGAKNKTILDDAVFPVLGLKPSSVETELQDLRSLAATTRAD
jgi:tRNA1(Val) A37 N6-methylase TrmN6